LYSRARVQKDNSVKDLFSEHSKLYSQFRPTYPEALYEFIFSHVTNFDTAWDCGTGNGQSARVLGEKFKRVLATDISAKQIEQAYKSDTILYSVCGEKTSFADSSVDLVTVAQAIHWFNMDTFYQEVSRVAKPNAILAVWGYSLLSIKQEVDSLLHDFYKNVVGSYWDKERHLVDEQYKTIPFPFEEIKTPPFDFSFEWTIEQLAGYLSTWSAVRKYMQANKTDPVIKLIEAITPLWNERSMRITFPLFVRMGRVNPR
jgi:ubiquinone/menaquinone biosynthesis C-methylase UbiE